MEIPTSQVKELRDQTGISVMQCKKALEEAGGNVEKALLILRKKAGAAAEKKTGRTLGAGVVQAYVHNTNDVGAIAVLSCETDFVAKNPEFVTLAREIAMQVVATAPKYARRAGIGKKDEKTLREVFKKEASGKPQAVQDKIVAGKFDDYFKETALLEQPYIKDPDRSIQDLIEEAMQKFGERIELTDFARYSVR